MTIHSPVIWDINGSALAAFCKAAENYRCGSESNAMNSFMEAPIESRNHVYGQLYSLVPDLRKKSTSYNIGELAFHNQNALSATPEQKAQAIENYLIQIVSATKLESPTKRYLSLHHLFEEIIELLNRSDPSGLSLFRKLPKDVQDGVLGFSQHATPEENVRALQTYLIQSLVNMFINNDLSAMDLFAKMTPETKNGIYCELYQLMIPWKKDYWGCAQDAFHGQKGQSATPEQKGLAVKNHLNRVVLKLQSLSPIFMLYDLQPRLNASEPHLSSMELSSEQEEAAELFSACVGSRSICSKKFLDGLTSHLHQALIKVGDVSYVPVSGCTQDFSIHPVASAGSSPNREILLLDPKNTSLLDQHYSKLRQKLKKEMTTRDILFTVGEYVRRDVFPRNYVREVMEMIEGAKFKYPTTTHRDHPAKKIPIIPIDKFIERRLGVCRHHVLVLSYMIDRLLHETNPLISGTVQHIRGNIPEGAHVWITFIPMRLSPDTPPEKYHLDTSCNEVVLINFAVEQNQEALSKAYGKEMFADQLTRTNNAALRNKQPVN